MAIRCGKMQIADGRRRAAKVPIAVIVAVVFTLINFNRATASVRISSDYGGPMGHYLEMFLRVRDSGEQVIIDGDCFSACTLVLAVIPRDRICVTPSARLGFHATWSPDDQRTPSTSPSITRALLELYPPPIRRWIRLHGGLNKTLIVLSGRELMMMYRSC